MDHFKIMMSQRFLQKLTLNLTKYLSTNCSMINLKSKKNFLCMPGIMQQTSYNVNTLSPLTSAFNSKPNKTEKLNFMENDVGLFGIPQLTHAEGFHLLQLDAIAESDKLLKECCSPSRSRKMVEVFDNLSDALCKVADLAEFIRMAHPDYNYSNAAEKACLTIGGLVEELNTHSQLYKCLKAAVMEGDIVPTSDVDQHVAKLFLFDFEQSGIHLDEINRQKVTSLNENILKLGQKFLHGTIDPRIISKDQLPEGIRHQFNIVGSNITISSLFADAPMEITREAAYRVYLHPEKLQEQRLCSLLESRHQLATICGFPSFAHRAINGCLAETPELVNAFLDKLSQAIDPAVKEENKEMGDMKKRICNSNKVVAPWDVPFLTGLARRENLKTDLNNSVASYFSLGVVMDGLSNLLRDLYGIFLQVEETKPGERWTPEVLKLAVVHETEGVLGHVYCDFFERPEKANQDCHFTIRGGKERNDGSYQNPIVVLHLNLPAPTWSTPSLLSLSMLENLFHEMGHAVHSMLARTKYQHVTGTRCSTDFAEVPSVLMEFFANDPRVLHRIGRHYSTGEQIPLKVLQQIISSKTVFSASELKLQLFYSALDQRYHSVDRWSSNVSTMDILAETQNKYYHLPHIKNTAWQLRFGHLVGYGAKYYSYLMSRAVASWIWQQYFRENPFNREMGEKLRKEVLSHGGGKPPKLMVGDFLGKEITPENLVYALVSDIEAKKDNYRSTDS